MKLNFLKFGKINSDAEKSFRFHKNLFFENFHPDTFNSEYCDDYYGDLEDEYQYTVEENQDCGYESYNNTGRFSNRIKNLPVPLTGNSVCFD